MKIVAIQDNPIVGDIDGNIRMVLSHREKHLDKDLIVFSECFLSGYPLGDLVLNPSFINRVRIALNKIIEDVHNNDGPAVFITAPLQGPGKPYNGGLLIDTDGSVQITYKHHLPNELVYDEIRTFNHGPLPKPLNFRGTKIGFPICEDIWHGDTVRHLVEEGAKMIISPNGSHFTVGKQSVREKLVKEQAKRYGIPFMYINQYGGQDDVIFDGGSFVVDSKGDFLNTPVHFQSDTIVFTGSYILGPIYNISGHVPNYEQDVYQACVLGLKDFTRKCGFHQVVIGNSGGLDSAMTAMIAVDALGKDNVLLVSMPSGYTSDESKTDGSELAKNLGCREIEVPIRNLVIAYNGYDNHLKELGIKKNDLASENLQARFRSQILFDISKKTHHMVLATGNRSELSVGYSTLGGDLMGAYNVLKGIFKSTIPAIAKWRNDLTQNPFGFCGDVNKELMPFNIMYKKPSAELSEGQTDENTLGAYPVLDFVLKCLIDKSMTQSATLKKLHKQDLQEMTLDGMRIINPMDYDIEYIQKIAKLIKVAQFKRRQAPPGVIIEDKDFSLDYRLPIAGKW